MTTELEPQERKRLWFELGLIAALSLGQASVYAIVRLADIATRGPISHAQAKLNTSISPRPGFDLIYQLLDIGFDRRGVCQHTTCADVYIDASPGGTRRYCSDSCQNRANVAAYRARKRAEQAEG